MAEEEKKSFLLYTDRWKEIQMLSNEQCGILFKAIFTYVNTGVRLETNDLTLQVLFSVLTSQIDEGTRRWEATRKARSEAGKRGGAPKGNKNAANKQKQTKQTKQANVSENKQKQTKTNKQKQNQTKQAVTVTDTVTTVSDTVPVSDTPQDSTALERAALPAPGEEEVIPWDEIDFELV
ncbi:DUF6291 domain-containing protein [uncultured Ruminococcus sp.]|uniref:DUF6291 domain-containing protein n=1 Tax=uncultured Ruminococcus sp. TaxID=165186 RepID=UPI0025889C69|nr:DUF6291 domain-containing protein [uncultured Ruminococcus sp.]